MQCLICLKNFNKNKLQNITHRHQSSIISCFVALIDNDKMCQECVDLINFENQSQSYQELIIITKNAYDNVIQQYPNVLSNYKNKSCITFMLGDFKQTIETCNLALAVDPDYFPACFNKGVSFFISY